MTRSLFALLHLLAPGISYVQAALVPVLVVLAVAMARGFGVPSP